MESKTMQAASGGSNADDRNTATATVTVKTWVTPQFEREPLKDALSGVSSHYDNATSS